MHRRKFIQQSSLAGIALSSPAILKAAHLKTSFPIVRTPENERRFKSALVEETIKTVQNGVKNEELGWLFHNCFPNTLDTTVFPYEENGKHYTYVITGDIDAMWLRDSSAQVWPYLPLTKEDKDLQELIRGLIRKQSKCINIDPYANAFYNDPKRTGEWADDDTDMKPGIHERKWEIDSLCYPIRLSYHYWKTSGDTAPFDEEWLEAQKNIYQTFKEQQRKEGLGPYHFMRTTPRGSDTLQVDGYGYPVKPVGLICSSFRPSDDSTIFSFLIPSNLFAMVSLRHSAEILEEVKGEDKMAKEFRALADEVEKAVKEYGIIDHPKFGRVYAFEVDGFGSHLMMDDSNIPSILSLPYLEAVDVNDEVYQRTRDYVLSENNPFFFKGKAGEGIGGPHIGRDYIWPMSIIMRGMTSTDEDEIKNCIETLVNTHGGTGFMHESFHKDDPTDFTREWFAWTNTLFGEFILKTFNEKPHLIQ